MEKLNNYRTQGWIYAIAGIAIFALFAYRAYLNDPTELIIGTVCLLILGYRSYSSFRSHRAEDETAVLLTEDNREEQLAYYNRIFYLALIVFPLLSVWTYTELSALESGEIYSASFWYPVVLLYDSLGFWPAALLFPLLGIFVTGSLYKKRAALKMEK